MPTNLILQQIKANKALAAAGLVAFSVLAFYFTRSSIFAVLGFVAILLLVFADLVSSPSSAKGGAGETDFKKTLLELGQALAFALIIWLALQFTLQTSAPIDVVTSCSMLPALERGDLIFVRGAEIRAQRLRFEGSVESLRGRLGVRKQPCSVLVAGRPMPASCTDALVLDGKTHALNLDGEIVVFEPQPRDYGLIVHRAAATLYNGTHEFLFTKGDNNQAIDQEAGFAPVPPSDVRGIVLLRIPLVGFLKLFLFMQFDEPPGCKQLLQAGA